MNLSSLCLCLALPAVSALTCQAQAEWTQRNPFPGPTLNAMVWTGKQLVAVGQGGAVATSPDGIAWTSRSSGTSSNLEDIAWTGTQLVAVGGHRESSTTFWVATILTSPDGETWTVRATDQHDWYRGVAWTGTRLVAVGDLGFAAISTDGIAWTLRKKLADTSLHAVTWSGTRLAAVGEWGALYTSPDGLTWTRQPSPVGYEDLRYVTYAGDQFLALGGHSAYDRETRQTVSRDILLTSPDAVSWTSRRDVTSFGAKPDLLLSGTWTGTQFVFVGTNGTVAGSFDGVTWSKSNTGVPSGLNTVAWVGDQLVALGETGTILTSPRPPLHALARRRPPGNASTRFPFLSPHFTRHGQGADPWIQADSWTLSGRRLPRAIPTFAQARSK